MKKLIALLLVVTLMMSLTACELLEKIPFVSDLLQSEKDNTPDGTVRDDVNIDGNSPGLYPADEEEGTQEEETPAQDENPVEDETPTQDETIATQPQFPEDAPHLPLYWQTIRDFRTILQHRLKPDWSWDGTMPPVSDTMTQMLKDASHMSSQWAAMIADLPTYDARSENAFGYILYDLNNDDVPELFFVRNDYSIVAVFTCYRDQLKLLATCSSRAAGYVSENGTFYAWAAGGASDVICETYCLQKGELDRTFYFESATGVTSVEPIFTEATSYDNRFEIDESTYDLYCHQFPNDITWFWRSFPIYALSHIPTQYDGGGEKEPNTKYLPYLQKVKAESYPTFAGPGYHYAQQENIDQPGTFTIVAEVTDWEGFRWGKLKSGNRWICLSDLS